jgi:hypothetical protein
MAMPTVSRRDRLVDLAALALIIAGIALYLDGTARLRAITLLSYQHPGPPGISQVTLVERARYECNTAIGLTLAGCAVGIAGAVSHGRQRRTAAVT